MKILFLSERSDWRTARIEQRLFAAGDVFEKTRQPITPVDIRGFDLGLSYGYQHLLKPDVLTNWTAINLHISYLPWNRGADPNIWSWIEGTPKGVSIHLIDKGIDTGPMYCQRLVPMTDAESLASSYDKLSNAMLELFDDNWMLIRDRKIAPQPQKSNGTIHFDRDRAKIQHIIDMGYDVPIRKLLSQLV
jgi:methionyl-tRNA formyltransferase